MSETVVVLKSRDLCSAFEALVEEHGLEVERIPGLPRFFTFPGVDPKAFPLKDFNGIESIEDGDHELHPEDSPVGRGEVHRLKKGGWAPARIINRVSPWRPPNHGPDASATFKCKRTGKGVDIFMVDSGCYISHREFEDRAEQPFLLRESYSEPQDDSGHGTACLSVAGGKLLGIARKARLYSFKFHNGASGASTAGFIKAMGAVKDYYERHASEGRPGVAFCSWGGFTPAINSVVSDCIDVGLVCCFPAGNRNDDLDVIERYPAEGDPDTIICGGLNIRDRPFYTFDGYGTSFGSPVDIMAPGELVMVARRPEDQGNYILANGTSYSTPYVAGVLACMLEGHERLTTRRQVRALKRKLKANSTKRQLRRGYAPGSKTPDPVDPDKDTHRLPNRILYLDPHIDFEHIPGLNT